MLVTIDQDDDKPHEECGVFGVWNGGDAAALTALGLHALQHRGQEAAGIVTLDEKGRSHAERAVRAPLEMSYSQTMRRLFGIESDFDVETEKLFKELQATATRVLKGESGAREELDRRAAELKTRGEEIAQLVQFELNQLNRLTPRPTGT